VLCLLVRLLGAVHDVAAPVVEGDQGSILPNFHSGPKLFGKKVLVSNFGQMSTLKIKHNYLYE
jgi:hypothetical protein